ncbi:FkbM family methyltransferase [Flavobacterium terrae]|uniref:Methyltransferase, FkbM family n=1 Tax=Flavobacterium terrae TaxID=415425 RepID=A0A1M6FRT2_9FLAO|nr:FkbM family methyltransferase [Flavobacterium terrae]SHJ00438.1 methyltransferase, FkbM family [Flavobacterium terrae]
MLKVIKKIYTYIFKKKLSPDDFFEREVAKNKLIQNIEKNENHFLIKTPNLSLVVRNQNHSDFSVFKQVFNKKEYKAITSYLKINLVKNDKMTLIDAGANVGYTSIFFLNEIKNIQVYGIEPSKDNMEVYKKNVDLNNYKKNVFFYENALSGIENKSFSLNNSFRDGKDWSIATSENIDGEIKGITINQIIKEHELEHISCLKIDIEGAERFIFTYDNDLSFLNITYLIAIEIHDEYDCRKTIYEILKEYNFVLFETGELTIGINKKFI